MGIKACVLAGLVLWSCSVVPLFSQEPDLTRTAAVLKGVPQDSINATFGVVEPGDNNYCRVRRDEIYRNSLCGVLENAGFHVNNSSCLRNDSTILEKRDILWMSLEAKLIKDVCVGMVKLEMTRQLRTPAEFEDIPHRFYRYASVWEKNAIVTGLPFPNWEFHDVAQDKAEDLTKDFLIKWLRDNQQ